MPLHHISITVNDIEKARDFYVATLKPLGYKIVLNLLDGKVLGFGGMCGPDFWLASVDSPNADGSDVRHKDLQPVEKPVAKPPTGRVHIAFSACSRQKVREFHEAAIAAGGECNGTPGLRPEYFATYYSAFVLDPDGRNIEAVCTRPRFIAEPWGALGWSIAGVIVGAIGAAVGKYYFGWF